MCVIDWVSLQEHWSESESFHFFFQALQWPCRCENGPGETTVVEGEQSPVVGLWGRPWGVHWPPRLTSRILSIDCWCQLVPTHATKAFGMSCRVVMGWRYDDVEANSHEHTTSLSVAAFLRRAGGSMLARTGSWNLLMTFKDTTPVIYTRRFREDWLNLVKLVKELYWPTVIYGYHRSQHFALQHWSVLLLTDSAVWHIQRCLYVQQQQVGSHTRWQGRHRLCISCWWSFNDIWRSRTPTGSDCWSGPSICTVCVYYNCWSPAFLFPVIIILSFYMYVLYAHSDVYHMTFLSIFR